MKGPIIVINFKTYIEATGKRAVELAKSAEVVARDRGISIAVAPQFTDLKSVCELTGLPVFSQHIDPVRPGAYTGHVLAEAVRSSGAVGTLLNHSERRIKISEIEESVELAHGSDLIALVCANTAAVSAGVAALNPDMIAVEPPELIGSGVAVSKSRPELITTTVSKIRGVDSKVRILCGAGVSTPEDVSKALELGTEGVLVASSVVKSKNPGKLLDQMAQAAVANC